MKNKKTTQENYTKSLKYISWTLNIILVILIILSLQLGFLSRQLSYTQETILLHDKINLEALSCVEDPYCDITLELRDIYLDIKEAE